MRLYIQDTHSHVSETVVSFHLTEQEIQISLPLCLSFSLSFCSLPQRAADTLRADADRWVNLTPSLIYHTFWYIYFLLSPEICYQKSFYDQRSHNCLFVFIKTIFIFFGCVLLVCLKNVFINVLFTWEWGKKSALTQAEGWLLDQILFWTSPCFNICFFA